VRRVLGVALVEDVGTCEEHLGRILALRGRMFSSHSPNLS
jgi:hypothetical protein